MLHSLDFSPGYSQANLNNLSLSLLPTILLRVWTSVECHVSEFFFLEGCVLSDILLLKSICLISPI